MACNNLQIVVAVSNQTPHVGDIVSCTATVTNPWTTTEMYHVVFTADGNEFGRSGVMTIEPGVIMKLQYSFRQQFG